MVLSRNLFITAAEFLRKIFWIFSQYKSIEFVLILILENINSKWNYIRIHDQHKYKKCMEEKFQLTLNPNGITLNTNQT